MGWSREQHDAMIARFNEQLASDPGLAGKILVTSGEGLGTGEVPPGLADRLYEQGSRYNPALDKQTLNNLLSEIQPATSVGTSNFDIKDEKYLAVMATADPSEDVGEAMEIFSRTNADFSQILSTEFTQTFTAAHELGHTVTGLVQHAENGDYSYNGMERNGDAFAAIYWIQNGGDLQSLEIMAEARNAALAYRPDRGEYSQKLTHDTAGTLEAIIRDAKTGIISAESLKDKTLSNIGKMALQYVSDTQPNLRQFREMESEQDYLRAINSRRVFDPEVRQRILNDFAHAAAPENPLQQELVRRVSHAVGILMDEDANDRLEQDRRYSEILSGPDTGLPEDIGGDAPAVRFSGLDIKIGEGGFLTATHNQAADPSAAPLPQLAAAEPRRVVAALTPML